MVSGNMPFFQVINLKSKEVVATDLWSKEEAIKTAKTLGKKHKADMAVYQMKQIFSTDTGELTIKF